MEDVGFGVDAARRKRRVSAVVSRAEDVVSYGQVGEAKLFGLHRIVTKDEWIKADELLGNGEADFHQATT